MTADLLLGKQGKGIEYILAGLKLSSLIRPTTLDRATPSKR
jgi:hypothetical protein